MRGGRPESRLSGAKALLCLQSPISKDALTKADNLCPWLGPAAAALLQVHAPLSSWEVWQEALRLTAGQEGAWCPPGSREGDRHWDFSSLEAHMLEVRGEHSRTLLHACTEGGRNVQVCR